MPAPESQNIPEDLANYLENLGNQLVWRIGKDDLHDTIVVRLGYASSTPNFAYLSKLRTVNDAELQAACEENKLLIEWID
jgi:hypothetical protein